jgi:hypothetical protein
LPGPREAVVNSLLKRLGPGEFEGGRRVAVAYMWRTGWLACCQPVRYSAEASMASCAPVPLRSLMRELGLEPCQPRPWRVSLTEGDGKEHGIPDLVDRDFTADAPGKMVGDITFSAQFPVMCSCAGGARSPG